MHQVHFNNDQHSASLWLKNDGEGNVLSVSMCFTHVLLALNSMSVHRNERKLRKSEYLYDIRLNSYVKNC